MTTYDISGSKIGFLVATEGVEQIELTDPWSAVQDADGEPVLISTETGAVKAFDGLDRAGTFEATRAVSDIAVAELDALVLPGGVANGDFLRMDKGAVAFIRSFVESGRPVAAICHAIWALVEADVVRDRTLTSYPSLQTDVRNAGGSWVDETVVVDGNLITSRNPDDLPAFNAALLDAVSARTAQ